MMRLILFRSLFYLVFCTLTSHGWPWRLKEGGKNVCKKYYYYQEKYHVDCGFWNWQACPRYRSVRSYSLECCPNYSSNNFEKNECTYAICANRINPTGACNVFYTNDKIVYQPGNREQRHSGGQCDFPNTCSNCNDGFYAKGPYCKICPKIQNCLHRQCKSEDNVTCAYCEGEYASLNRPFWNAYIRGINGDFKKCKKACSWRKDSTRCYPGNCADHGLASSCKCIDGFGEPQCVKIVKNANVTFVLAKLLGPGDPIESPADPNEPLKSDTRWTNEQVIKKASLKVTGVFRSKDNYTKPDERGQDHFVTEFKYGITTGEVRLTFLRDSDFTLDPIVIKCIPLLPTTEEYTCRGEISLENDPEWGKLSHFSHNDRVIFSYSITNGGWLRYVDRDVHKDPNLETPTIRVPLEGRTVSTKFTFHWDLEDPYQTCVKLKALHCTVPPVNVVDVTNVSVFQLQWSSWTDDLAGVDEYIYEIYGLTDRGAELAEDKKVKDGKISSHLDGTASTTSGVLYKILNKFRTLNQWIMRSIFDEFTGAKALNVTAEQQSISVQVMQKHHDNVNTWLPRAITLNVDSPGMYSVVFYAIDKAGNYREARTVFLYDDKSKVETHPDKVIRVKQSTPQTVYTWIVVNDRDLIVTWKGKFRNVNHYAKNWLERIRLRPKMELEYDDHYGKRTTSAVSNKQGIVRFETQFVVLSPTVSQQTAFKMTENVLDESTTLPVTWNDGDRLDITVRAYDILDVYVDDNITVYKDSSPPEIENLWLSNGGRVNISVHSVEDFTKMTIEWNAFDYHSGLDNVQWRLFDNYTKTDILHGYDTLHAQGNVMDITLCKSKYADSPRGPNCYCTSFHGCFHQHFFVTPKINDHSGLIVGKDKGVHDSDYYIEVTVVNKAKLKTTISKKITIDVSPPHEGTVHDGIRGYPEIDYQQDLNLNAHWDGFFDRESGVEFYEYIFSDHCFSNKEFKNCTETQETYNTFASYHAPTEGIYIISVVAVNRAKEKSNVVCSDGVTITTEVPQVTNFVLDGASTRSRLVNDNNKRTWYIDNALRRHSAENISFTCSSLMEVNVSILPEAEPVFKINHLMCDKSKDVHLFGVLRKLSQFKMSWKPVVDDHLIHDYEIGISSTESSMSPDIVPFRTTKHHTHFRLNHPDVPHGKEFYIVVKTISNTGMEGMQNIGPFILDTTKPQFTGKNIDVELVGEYLRANWSSDVFSDPEDPYPMEFHFAVGHQPQMYDILPFTNLIFSGPCKETIPSTCTALPISDLQWSLHGHHQYFFTLKATNLAGLSVYQASDPYEHDVQLPAEGIVLDLLTPITEFNERNDIQDIDFTTNSSALAIKWSGFVHPHQDVAYRSCVGTAPKLCDVRQYEKASELSEMHIFIGLKLQHFQEYYVTIEASTSAGRVAVSTDGVILLNIHQNLTGIEVRDGYNCTDLDELKTLHHEQDTRPKCYENIDFQTSTTSLRIYWAVPDKYKYYVKDIWIKLDRRLLGDVWVNFTDFQYVGNHNFVTLSNLNLQPGKSYRPVLKFCAESYCFPEVRGNGITVISNPPKKGNMSIVFEGNQLTVQFERMIDPDIQGYDEAANAVNVYEWAVGDNDGIQTIWHTLKNDISLDQKHRQFVIPLNSSMDFSKCRKIYIRGYNKAGIWSTMSKEIKTCSVKDGNSLIVPNIVIDAIGKPETSLDGVRRDGYGKDIYLATNERWEEPDVDYTPFKNIISATWPLLRHHYYSWVVIDADNLDFSGYYKTDYTLQLVDPCSHPNAIKCGHTEKEYVNIFFNSKEEIIHGKRYLVCIHAQRTEIKHEKWTEVLKEVKTCSDGVTVDLTPPKPGIVWIGTDPSNKYQSSISEIFVSWESFTDVEEYGITVHSTGIKEYFVGIGSTEGGTDVMSFTSVGLVNHFTVNGLRLLDGHNYYAVVKAIDFAGRDSKATSNPLKIDSSPPEISNEPITIKGRLFSNMNEIDACWRDVFMDTESGIDHYLWAVGSHLRHDDIIPFTKTTLDCGVSAEDGSINLHEGHAYFITIKAINRAKLVSTASSWAYIYDMSPPIPGHVYDGSPDKVPSYTKDIDYQTDTKTLSSYWEGFHDPHSTIKAFYVSIGTCANCEDVLTNQDIGISKNFTLCHMHLGPGILYYTTITACNTADLCTSVTSDGVVIDNSPPSQGIILDGVDAYDIEYQSLRNYMSARWYGFTDPQSRLDYFTWRAGTQPGMDDIVRSSHLPLTDILVEPDLNLQLPIGKRVYVTIKAYNKAGLSTEATSNGFVIDDTPPLIKVKPYLSTDLGSIKDNSLVFRNTIRVKWEVEDPESYIQRQYLSISSHKGGHFNSSSTEINGIVRDYTFSRLDLHDGGYYTVKLIVCNGAKICVECESEGITVDSSPPTPGMFAIKTDHAANLHRHVEGWMTWSRYKLWLSWLGFTDLHTRIDKYYVSVGSQYMIGDLNKGAGSPQEFLHNQSGVDKQDEGFVQTFEVDVKNLVKFEHVFVSVWAVNQVGLRSMMIHSQFRLVPGGLLELIRRCSAVSCKGHCVCTAQGRRCSINGIKCHDKSKGNRNSLLAVYDITDVRSMSAFSDVKYTPSNVALAAKWHIVQAQGLKPLWYEWSAGLTKSTTVEGIFTQSDDVWHHAGQTNMAILNLKHGNVLKEPGMAYSIVVRAWYSKDTYADFKTDGVFVLSLSLSRRKIKGSKVVEQIPGQWKKDVDFIKPGAPFTIRWTNVFKDDTNVIDRFKVYLSTYPGGHDIHAVELDLPGSVTSHNISRVPLTPGIVFYSNVVGYSRSGIHATESSDGILIESLPPISGTVGDGIGPYDIDYQNSTEIVSASWHGFSDRDSGISHYMWCVQKKSSTEDTCDIRSWENVGIQRIVSRTLNVSSIYSGTEYESLVYAIDNIGHKSNIAKSNGVVIDLTHPEPTSLEHLERNIAFNPSFEDYDNNHQLANWEQIKNVSLCTGSYKAVPSKWNISHGSCVSVLKSNKNIAMDGRTFLFVEGEITQMLYNLRVNKLYRVTFVTSHSQLLGAVLANNEGYVDFDGNRHVFMIYTKQNKHSTAASDLVWHHHTFYVRSKRPEMILKLGSMTGNTGILFDDVKVQETVLHDNSDVSRTGKHVHAHIISLHQWSSIHASWSFVDPESPIVDYMWAIGYTEGSTEVQGFKSVGLSNFAYNYNVTLAHTSVIHITVVATNAAGLRHEAHAEDLLVDLTPPEIFFINDGIGPDIAAQTSEEITANWDVKDTESGLDYCEWAVGYQPHGNEIQTFKKLPNGIKTVSKVFPSNQVSMQMVHVSLRCRNHAGLQSSLSTDGVQISNLPPNTTYAQVEILPQSLTEYNVRGRYQGDTASVRLKWTGFEDVTGIDSYMLTFEGKRHTTALTKSLTSEERDASYCIIRGIDMETGKYTVSVKAINKMYLRSPSVKSEIEVSFIHPQLTDNPDLRLIVDNRTLTASWIDHFKTTEPIYYEVSAGTTFGSADIIQWQETKNTFLEFILPPKIKSVKHITGYVIVRGVSANGMTTVLNAAVKLT